MTKAVRRSITVIRNGTSMWKGYTITAATTILIPTKKSRKKRSIGATTITIGGGVAMIIDALPTIAAVRLGPVQTVVLASQGSNTVTRRVPRRNNAKSLIGSIARSPVTTDSFNKHGKNNWLPWKPSPPQSWRKENPMYIALCANN